MICTKGLTTQCLTPWLMITNELRQVGIVVLMDGSSFCINYTVKDIVQIIGDLYSNAIINLPNLT